MFQKTYADRGIKQAPVLETNIRLSETNNLYANSIKDVVVGPCEAVTGFPGARNNVLPGKE